MVASRNSGIPILAAVLLSGGSLPAGSAEKALDKAFEDLQSYEWSSDRGALKPIDNAVTAAHADAGAARQLESRLAALLQARPPQAAQDYLCRQLSLVGSAACVPALAGLLDDEQLSHMARYALERIPDPAAVDALRQALPKLNGALQVGVINSLGVRRDADSTAVLIALLGEAEDQVAAAAAAALGAIGNADAAKALGEFRKNDSEALRRVAADACLACGERLLADGQKMAAMAIYKSLAAADQPRHIRLAATRGLLAITQQK